MATMTSLPHPVVCDGRRMCGGGGGGVDACSAYKRLGLEAFIASSHPSKRPRLSEDEAKMSKLFMPSCDKKNKKVASGVVVVDSRPSSKIIDAKVMKKEVDVRKKRAGTKSNTAATSEDRGLGNHLHRQRLHRPAMMTEHCRVRPPPQIKLVKIPDVPKIRPTDPPRELLPNNPPRDESRRRQHRDPPRRAAPQASSKMISQERQLEREAARRALLKMEEEAEERFKRDRPLRPEDILQILPSLHHQYLHSRPRPRPRPRPAAAPARKPADSAQSNKLNASPADDIEKLRPDQMKKLFENTKPRASF